MVEEFLEQTEEMKYHQMILFSIDSNKLGVYFSPTDVVNEDIIYSVADFNFDDIGDPQGPIQTRV